MAIIWMNYKPIKAILFQFLMYGKRMDTYNKVRV